MQSPNLGLRNAAPDGHESEAQARSAQTRRHTLAALNDSRALTLRWRPVKGPIGNHSSSPTPKQGERILVRLALLIQPVRASNKQQRQPKQSIEYGCNAGSSFSLVAYEASAGASATALASGAKKLHPL